MKRPERFDRHRRAEVAAADADVDDVREALAAGAGAAALVHVAHERGALRAHGQDLGMQRRERRRQCRARRRPQQRVQRGAALAVVDDRAVEHRVDALAKRSGIGQPDERVQRLGIEALAAEVEQQSVEFARKGGEAIRVLREQVPDRHPGQAIRVIREDVSQGS